MLTKLLILACAALVLLGCATPALSEETRTLTARWVLDVERGEIIANGIIIVKGDRNIIAVQGNPLDDLNALQKVTFAMKAGQPIDRSTL